MNVVKKLLCIGCCIVLSACTNLSMQGERLYQHSVNGPNLVVNPPLSQAEISHFYDLPSVGSTGPVNTTPPNMKVVEDETEKSQG